MSIVNKYLQKVADTTEDPDLSHGIKELLDSDVYDDFPSVTKPKSSFKDANRRMKEIEDGKYDKK